MIKNHIRRVLGSSFTLMRDPRRRVGRWSFDELITGIMSALLSGCRNLRELELFSSISGRRIPDTTLWDLLVELDPAPLDTALARSVKQASRCHELAARELPFHLTVVDGKSLSVTKSPVGEWSINRSQKGCSKYVHTALRALIASGPVKLFLGQQPVKQGTNERGAFKSFLDKLVLLYGKTNLLEVISVDAGITSIKNAAAVRAHDLHYIMALKDARTRNATRVAIEVLGNRTDADKTEYEHTKGKHCTRRLYRAPAPSLKGWEHATEIWRVEKVTRHSDGTIVRDDRYFITSIPRRRLKSHDVLKAVRLHWSIENNGNWVLDTAWKEDDYPWCNKALEVVSLLRLHAYNTVARLKLRRLRRTKLANITWPGLLQVIRLELFALQNACALPS